MDAERAAWEPLIEAVRPFFGVSRISPIARWNCAAAVPGSALSREEKQRGADRLYEKNRSQAAPSRGTCHHSLSLPPSTRHNEISSHSSRSVPRRAETCAVIATWRSLARKSVGVEL